MSMLFKFVDNLLEHVRYRPSPHIFRWSAEHDLRGLNQKVFKYFEIKQRRILILLLQMSIYLLNCMLNFLHS